VVDRWIYVFTAACLIAVVFAGFLPDSFTKVAAIEAGKRPPFPPILHVHAVLMGSFLLLLLAQTVLVAIGKTTGHMQLGIAAMILIPAIVISGIVLVPTEVSHRLERSTNRITGSGTAAARHRQCTVAAIFGGLSLFHLHADRLARQKTRCRAA
jgi:hypothetical protein